MAETGEKRTGVGRTLLGGEATRHFTHRTALVKGAVAYCTRMQERLDAGEVTDAIVGAHRGVLRDRIFGLPDETLNALEAAADGKKPRESKMVISVAEKLGVTVGAVLKEF